MIGIASSLAQARNQRQMFEAMWQIQQQAACDAVCERNFHDHHGILARWPHKSYLRYWYDRPWRKTSIPKIARTLDCA